MNKDVYIYTVSQINWATLLQIGHKSRSLHSEHHV